ALKLFCFEYDEALAMYRARETPRLRAFVETNNVEYECLAESVIDPIGTDRYEKLQAVKRWFYNDWRRIEPKLRTSIVEGISVFLSLFDDNRVVKRTFCPPVECYDPAENRDLRCVVPPPSFS